MRRPLTSSLCLLVLSLSYIGCDSTSPTSVNVFADNVAWLPNEQGMIALVEKETVSSIDNSTNFTIGLYTVSVDGTLGSVIGPGDVRESSWNAAVLFLSQDASTAIAQVGPNIIRVNTHDNSTTQLVNNATLLGVSPDGKYVISTTSERGDRAPNYIIYDVTVGPARRIVQQFTPPNIYNDTRCLWLDNGSFVVTGFDSIGSHVMVWDTTGTILRSYPNARTPLSSSAYSPASHELFVQTNKGSIDRINIETQERTSIVAIDSIESIDVSSDGTLLTYSSGKSSNAWALYAVNVKSGNSSSLAADAVAPVLSPNGDKVAFIHNAGSNRDIKVIGVSLPQ